MKRIEKNDERSIICLYIRPSKAPHRGSDLWLCHDQLIGLRITLIVAILLFKVPPLCLWSRPDGPKLKIQRRPIYPRQSNDSIKSSSRYTIYRVFAWRSLYLEPSCVHVYEHIWQLHDEYRAMKAKTFDAHICMCVPIYVYVYTYISVRFSEEWRIVESSGGFNHNYEILSSTYLAIIYPLIFN